MSYQLFRHPYSAVVHASCAPSCRPASNASHTDGRQGTTHSGFGWRNQTERLCRCQHIGCLRSENGDN